ncbi:hypothetical protein OHC33_010812 [Knufia fluminis]|uniref:Telomere-associated protein Rif1 N-terminal domain-containing protein n=1 Tax=Knufia fluminis TaxID=191047 RepID=A0AAN8E7S4_9EURO|nr:hypothetical protein OHC33_010812 [Knufia fluminis]
MSVHEVPLPSPPPDTHLRAPMSGLFSKAAGDILTFNGLSDPAGADSELVARKKVDFHPFAQNILDLPQLSTPESEVPPSLKSLPPSRDCQLSSRPILKHTLSLESTLGLDGQNERKSALDSMESLLQHLANNERSSSIDAYQSITNLIKMYDEAPEQETLQKKMAELQKYIRRDLVVLDTNADALPSEQRLSMGNLVMSALKVLVTMVWSPTYSPCLTDDFRTWTIERSIQVLKDHTAAKATLLHYMHLLATQSFDPRIMAHHNRVPRILEVLQNLTEHISGKAVVSERLLVYQKLVDQAKSTMKQKAKMWIKNLLTAMGHSFKEIRSNAISAGTKACTAFTGHLSVAAMAREALAEVNNERTLSSSISNRLERVLAAKDEANQIPQIWTIILMLCNSGNHKLDTWPQLHEWLKLIQRCFNCSDSTVRVQAFMAWNRLYYVARPTEASEKVVSMLAKPAMIQLDRTGNNQSGKGTRQAVISSYCMLLYYAFRPSAQHTQYTRMWNEFVVKVMTRSFLSNSSANCDLSCRVLSALFHSALPGSRVWNENRAHENTPVDPTELPAIDCKWIRSRMSSVLSIVRLLVDYSSFGPDGKLSEQSYAAQIWCNLIRSLRESTSKEVVPSADAKAAFTSILAFLKPSTSNQDDEVARSAAADRHALLASITIRVLGPCPILQALESPTERCNSILLQALVQRLAEHPDELGSQADQGKLYERCYALVEEDIRCIAQPQPHDNVVAGTELVRYTNNVLRQTPPSKATQCLLQIQDSAMMLIGGLQSSSDVELGTFGLIIVDLLVQVSPADYKDLDGLLVAVLRTEHRHIREALLEAWREMPLRDVKFSCGPGTIAAIAALRERSREESIRLAAGSEPSSVLFAALQLANKKSKSSADKPHGARPSSSDAASSTSRHQNTRSRPRHDDSQVQFVSIESSPPDYENFESQLLTARQKHVRARQRTEPALTFADIRSSTSTSKKQALITKPEDAGSKIPETPTTPTLPQSRARDDDDQPPTPTPRARRSLLNHLQPDVPSSPPSVVNGETVSKTAATITSSPVKDPAEMEIDDGVQLNGVDETDFALASRKSPAAAVGNQRTTSLVTSNQNMVSERPRSPEFPVGAGPHHPEDKPAAANEDVATTEADALTPTSYSDEYDALAASQLSQNLVEQSQESTISSEVQETPRSISKRKRSEAQHGHSGKKKKRRSSITTIHETYQEQAQNETAEVETDTIVVNMDKISSRPPAGREQSAQRDAAKTAASVPPTPPQASHKSATTTPSSRSSRGGRKPRTKRKTRSQASREGSPVAQIPVPAESSRVELVNLIHADSDVVMAEAQVLSSLELPSLTSEVPETADEEALAARLEHNEPIVNDTALAVPAAEEEPATEDHGTAEEALALTKAPLASTTRSQGTSIEFDLAKNLQGILDQLDTANSSILGKNLDLATIHSLCFKIGLKAQQLAATQQ